MTEMKKDYEWLEDEKFNEIAKDCSWRKEGTEYCKVMDKSEKYILCRKHLCGIWHFHKRLS